MLDYKDITPVVISWNRGDRLKKCIETLNDCPRIIIWDNDSKEEEKNKIKLIEEKFDNVEVVYNESNDGCVVGWNRGMILSDTDWVLWTVDDMIFDLDWLDIANKIIKERPNVEQIHLNAWNAMLFHKKTILRMGWWDEGMKVYPSMEDDDWYLRAVAVLGYSPYTGIPAHRQHQTSNEVREYLNTKHFNKVEENFNRDDNFMYFCNSPFSKYPVVGQTTITGNEDDAGSGVTDEALNEKRKQGIETGLDHFGNIWKEVNPLEIHTVNPQLEKHMYLGKDGRMWLRVLNINTEKNTIEINRLDKYVPGRDGMYLEETKKYLDKYGDINMKPISFIQPSRNNLKYLQWSYNSIRKNLGYVHEICMADDFSDDGTWEWMQEIAEKDKNVKIHRNEGPTRLGHTILYDTLINDYATNDIVMIYHADMYALPGLDAEIAKHIKPGVVVSATRIEPPLHPDGPEKILKDYGIEPEEFKEQELLKDLNSLKVINKTTEGIFAPWAIYKSDFQKIGGHDPLYAPQSKEDSDIFNRFLLAGYEFVQTWEGFVYHMTCRGSRFADGAKRNPDGQVFMKGRETEEWLKQNHRSTRNFIRKWGHFVKHDALLKPVVVPKYDIGFVVGKCKEDMLYELEPWCSTVYVDSPIIANYIEREQKETDFDLHERVTSIMDNADNDIVVEFDATEMNQEQFNYLVQLPDIIANDEELHEDESGAEFELGIFRIKINKLKTYEKELIVCES